MKNKQKQSSAGLSKVDNDRAIVEKLIRKKQITMDDIKGWPAKRIDLLYRIASKELSTSTLETYEDIALKYYHVSPEDGKNQIWDTNHNKILRALHDSIRESGIFPTKTYLSSKTGLSRNTIQQHLDRYADSQQQKYHQQSRQFIEMNLLGSLLMQAHRGDTKAARLYMEATGMIRAASASTRDSGHSAPSFVQINGTTINQTFINQLPDEILYDIEKLIKQNEFGLIKSTIENV
jgi:hypothetical protein